MLRENRRKIGLKINLKNFFREAVERLENEQREVLEGLKEIEEDENFLMRFFLIF